jgi:hypothetical protein
MNINKVGEKNKMKKRYMFGAVIMMLLVMLSIKVEVKAANVIDSGTYESAIWTLYDDGLLDITGSGNMLDLALEDEQEQSVTTMKIGEDIDTIDNDFVNGCENLKKVINNSYTEIYLYSDSDDDYSWCNIEDTSKEISEIARGTAVKISPRIPKYYTVSFKGNGATGGTMPSIKVKADSVKILPKNKFVRTGYIFDYWELPDDLDLESYYYDDEAQYLIDRGEIEISRDELEEYGEDTIKLKAHWRKDLYYGLKKVGSTIKDSKSKASYVVISDKKTNPTVKYVKSNNKNAKSVTVPASIKVGNVIYRVTEVGAKALKNNRKVKKVTLGKNVKKIDDEAFAGCIVLTNISLNANLTTIGEKAFNGCTALKSLSLPANTNKLGKQFAGDCTGLSTLTIKSKNMTAKTLADGAYLGIGDMVTIKVPDGKGMAYKQLFADKGLISEAKIDDPSIDMETGRPKSYAGRVVYNKNGIRITYLGLENEYDVFYKAKFRIENNSDDGICVSTDKSSINGYMYSLSSLGTVNPHTKSIDYFLLTSYGLQEKGINPYSTLKARFNWRIYDADSYDEIDYDTVCKMVF